jgi:hypothetical protein
VTGKEHQVRIDMVDGFEYTLAEIGRGGIHLAPSNRTHDSYGQFAEIISARAALFIELA